MGQNPSFPFTTQDKNHTILNYRDGAYDFVDYVPVPSTLKQLCKTRVCIIPTDNAEVLSRFRSDKKNGSFEDFLNVVRKRRLHVIVPLNTKSEVSLQDQINQACYGGRLQPGSLEFWCPDTRTGLKISPDFNCPQISMSWIPEATLANLETLTVDNLNFLADDDKNSHVKKIIVSGNGKFIAGNISGKNLRMISTARFDGKFGARWFTEQRFILLHKDSFFGKIPKLTNLVTVFKQPPFSGRGFEESALKTVPAEFQEKSAFVLLEWPVINWEEITIGAVFVKSMEERFKEHLGKSIKVFCYEVNGKRILVTESGTQTV